MNVTAIAVGFATFLIIGIFHPIVIKTEYYFSQKAWPIFLIAGIAFLIAALFCTNDAGATLLAILGFTCLWSCLLYTSYLAAPADSHLIRAKIPNQKIA